MCSDCTACKNDEYSHTQGLGQRESGSPSSRPAWASPRPLLRFSPVDTVDASEGLSNACGPATISQGNSAADGNCGLEQAAVRLRKKWLYSVGRRTDTRPGVCERM
eukprot:356731-Chlamydomonas_euryale.AAC.1